MRLSIEIGRINILMEVSCLYHYMCSPREGNINYAYRIFNYTQKNMGKKSGRMTYNPMYDQNYNNLFEVDGKDLNRWKYF